jgi:hypothetical protein
MVPFDPPNESLFLIRVPLFQANKHGKGGIRYGLFDPTSHLNGKNQTPPTGKTARSEKSNMKRRSTMKSKKTLCIVILTVVCVGLMVLTGFLITKTLHLGPLMPADTSKPSGEVNLKWETTFIEDTPTDMDIHVNTAPLGGTATGDTPEKPRGQVSFSGGESDVVGDMPSTEIPPGLYTIPAPTYRHPQGFTFQGWHCCSLMNL